MEVLWWLHKRTPGRLPLHFNIPAGHQSFVSASCSCDNRLWVMTTPVTRFPRREPRFPPIGTLEAPSSPPAGLFPILIGSGALSFSQTVELHAAQPSPPPTV